MISSSLLFSVAMGAFPGWILGNTLESYNSSNDPVIDSILKVAAIVFSVYGFYAAGKVTNLLPQHNLFQKSFALSAHIWLGTISFIAQTFLWVYVAEMVVPSEQA